MDRLKQNELFHIAAYSADAAERIGYSNYSYWKSVFHNFLKKKSAVAMAVVFAVVVAFSFVALEIGKYQYTELVSNASLYFHGVDSEFWFGCDAIGRDYWCQVWYAAQVSIKLALLVAAGEAVLGVVIGCLWGYVRLLDRPLTEVYNIINNVPTIIYMTLVGMIWGRSFSHMAIALIATGWLTMARNVRNIVLMYRDREYNLASRCLGTPVWRVLVKNVFPYLISVVILRLALSIPGTIATEPTLSYLGLGLGYDTPSLGLLLRDARMHFLDYPHLLVFPAVIVSAITLTFYLVGNAFSDAADPRNHV